MKLSTLPLLLLLASCTYAPWHYENYYPVETDKYQSGYYKSDDHVMKVSVLSTEVEPDVRKAPYRLWVKYIDHSMAHKNMNICNLVVTTTGSQSIIDNKGQCFEVPLEVGGLVEGVKPYAKSALFEHSDISLNFDAKEKLNVSFSYSLTNENGKKGQSKNIDLLFEPVLDKGTTKPCCLPSV